MIKLPTDRPASRQHTRHSKSSKCINFNSLNKCLPVILQFDYHLLLMATFNFDLTDCKSKTTKPDAKFNWKSFYFLISLIGGLCVNTAGCTLVQPESDMQSSSLTNIINSITIDSKPNKSQINKFDLSQTSESAPVPNDSRQLERTQYLSAAISPADQQANQTSSATSSTYQIFNRQTNDAHRLSINRKPKQTLNSVANQTNRTARESDDSIDEQRKPSNEPHGLHLPTNLTIRPSLITTYSAERQNAEAPPERPKNNFQVNSTDQAHLIPPSKRAASLSTQIDSGQFVTSLFSSGSAFRTEMESKMRRRFVADNSAEQQKGLNEEDSKNYNQKKRDKMQKMQNYEQQFDTLKKRLNTSTSSSFPINRHQKSIMQRHFGQENGLQSSVLSPADNLIVSSVNEIDLIPEEQQHRYMTNKRFCEVCFCSGLKIGTLKCARNNQIKFIPILSSDERMKITEIFLENQENFLELNEESLRYYPNITKLTIQNCGLKEIKDKSFRHTPLLKEINLKHNQIRILLRRLFDDLPFQELLINDNPLQCNCSSKWIQTWINKTAYAERLGVAAQNITCVDYSNVTKPLIEAAIRGCEMPVVTINQTSIEVHEGQSFSLSCKATGTPIPSLSWNITDLKSKYNITLKSIDNNPLANATISNGTGISVLSSHSTNSTHAANGNGTSPGKKSNKTQIKTLEVLFANGSDNGPFYCTGDNIVGKVTKVVNVTILAAPRFELLKHVQKYDSYCIEYRITGHPTPSKTWYFNNTLLDFKKSNISDTVYPNTNSNKRNQFAVNGCLNIKTQSHFLSGSYTLKIQNKYGESNRTIKAVFLDTRVEGVSLNPHPELVPSVQTSTVHTYDDRPANNHFLIILISSLCVLFSVFCVAFIFYLGCNYYSKKRISYKDNKIVAQEKMSLNLSRLVENPNYLEEKQQYLSIKGIGHIESKRIQLIKELGEGAFGRVYLGTVLELDADEKTLVAVKVLKHMPEQMSVEFEREAELLSQIEHENIVKFHGISIEKHPFMMIFEYMKLGDLNSFLRSYDMQSDGSILRKNSVTLPFHYHLKSTATVGNIEEPKAHFEENHVTATNETYQLSEQNDEDSAKESDHLIARNGLPRLSILEKKHSIDQNKNFETQSNISSESIAEELKCLDINDLFNISIQVSNGMKYLADQRFIHRDLATRNCLVNQTPDQRLIVKVGDFGMSRDVYATDYYKVGRQTVLPVRWMPVESIQYRKFSIESDVYSFGVLLWEVWTLGKQPFFESSNLEVIQLVLNGKKLDQPKHCPDEVYEVMNRCWKYHAQDRASMPEIYIQLNRIQQQYNGEE